MPKGDKFIALTAYLEKCGMDEVKMTFSEIEKIIGRELPATAYKKREWWSNNDRTHTQSAAWSDVGYKTCDIILGESVSFKKDH